VHFATNYFRSARFLWSAKFLWSVLLPLILFLFAYSGGVEYVGKKLTLFIRYYGETELQKLQGTGYYNAEGVAEYVISVKGQKNLNGGEQFLLAQSGVKSIRNTDFSDWYIVELDGDVAQTVSNLRALSEIGFAFPNRGTWFCH